MIPRKISTSPPTLDDADQSDDLPPNDLNLFSIYRFALPYYEHCMLKVPSVLRSLREIYCYDPDRIYIFTPGPLGLLGLMFARLMNVKSVGFYHTDFALRAKEVVEDESVANILEAYTKWFYTAMNEIRVPTKEYINMLEGRGFEPTKMNLLPVHPFYSQKRWYAAGRQFCAEEISIGQGRWIQYRN